MVEEIIGPRWPRARSVISDRYLLANVVYQGHAGGLDPATLWEIGRIATGGVMPDLTIVLDLPPEAAAGRMRRELDRMETQGDEFRQRVREGFLAEAARDPQRIRGDRREPTHRRGAGRDSTRGTNICQARMSWQGVHGQDDVVEQFRRSLVARAAGLHVPVPRAAGSGQADVRAEAAQTLLCSESPAERMQPCGRCPSCVQVQAGTHPDLFQIGKPKDKAEIPIALLIGEDDKRMKEGLCHDISLKPFMGGRRIAIIDDADHLNNAGANCLLKTLEEPPPQSVLILIGTKAERQLPTIRSRSQIVRFAPLTPDVLADLMLEQGIVDRSRAGPAAGPATAAAAWSGPPSWPIRTCGRSAASC